jgi:hypothetical protein
MPVNVGDMGASELHIAIDRRNIRGPINVGCEIGPELSTARALSPGPGWFAC